MLQGRSSFCSVSKAMENSENIQSESDSDIEFFDAADESPCVPCDKYVYTIYKK